MAILRLSIRPSEPCIFAIFKPTLFKFRGKFMLGGHLDFVRHFVLLLQLILYFYDLNYQNV
jgi:hypothetical protein